VAERIPPPADFAKRFPNPLWKVLRLDTSFGGFTSLVTGERHGYSYMVVDLKHERTGLLASEEHLKTITTFFIVELPQPVAGRTISRRPRGFATHADSRHVYLAKVGTQPRVADWLGILDEAIAVARTLQLPPSRAPDQVIEQAPRPRDQAGRAPLPTWKAQDRARRGGRPVLKSPVTGETVIEPVWGAAAAAAASLCGTWPVTEMWLDTGKSFDGGGFGRLALMFIGPLIYLVIFGSVGKLLVWILDNVEATAHRAGIVGLTLVFPLIGHGIPFFWEVVLAAIMGATAAWQFNRVLEDEEDLKRL
jgi:hypothetical protein